MESPLSGAVLALQQQRLVLLVDDASAQPRAFLMHAADSVTAADIATMANHGRGVVLAALSEARVRELGLSMMGGKERLPSFELTVSVEARQGVSTGISAADRAKTLSTLAATRDPKLDLVMPGHIFPVRAKQGGVLVRSDIPEAAIDLLDLAKLPPTAALCQCLDENGELLTEDAIAALAQSLGICRVSVTDVIRHRLSSEHIVEKIAEAKLPTFAGEFRAYGFLSRVDNAEHLALVLGDIGGTDTAAQPVLVRVQAEHRLSDLLGFENVLGLQRVRGALTKIAAHGRGIFIYVRHPRKGALRAQALALRGDAASKSLTPRGDAAELREHGIGAQILRFLGARKIVLLTNSSRDVPGLSAFNIEIVGRESFSPLEPGREEPEAKAESGA